MSENESGIIQAENELLESKFRYISVRNVASTVAKYLPGATPFDRKQGPQYCWMYVAAISHISNSEGSYSNRILCIHLGKNNNQSISNYRKIHKRRMEQNGRYRKLFMLVLNDLRKIDDQKQKQYLQAISK